nr:transcription factor 25-like [Onthophagus taurus]
MIFRALYITIFKHLLFVGGRACYRTALEFCKLLLSLDPDKDPLGVKLAIDFYALRSREYRWFIDFYEELEPTKNLSQLPNFAFSVAAAHFHLADGDLSHADDLLQDALLMFPGVLKPLLEKCSVQPDNRVSNHAFFDSKQSPVLTQLVLLYVNRSYHIWKESDLLPWLERNVNKVLDRVDKQDPIVKDYEGKRSKRYQGPMPKSICRHIILSDIKGVSPLPKDFTGGVLTFDPLPPDDSINIYSKPKRPKNTTSNSSTVGIFFRSLLPSFNPNELVGNLLEDEDGARALPDGEIGDGAEFGDLRRSVASLVGAMRDLLSHVPTPDVPNDADVDENDESDDDELNNYLT